ncbi:hypothetical protein [Corallococcus sp. EGB]|uniref:hypothetical protein n=1 Tax=Corallococcus sp. EGB TaxID=1521117 RepID=UPI001CBACEFB|nr:hypothetical protein [Corallococcus sp. EGB]
MHHVELPVGELNEFDLPPVCIVTGEQGEGVVFKPVKFVWHPRWIGLLIFCNALIALIVALAMTKRVKGALPFTEEAWSLWKRGQVIMGVSAVTTIALLLTSLSLLASRHPSPLGFLALVSAVALPVLAWFFFLRGRGPQVRRIDKGTIALAIPNRDAARALMGHFQAGLRAPVWNGEEGLDENGVPTRAVCARHEDIVANQVCPRCGAFMCPRCENRVRREAMPMCPGCWELRARVLAKPPDSLVTAPNVGLVLGLVSLLSLLIPFLIIIQPVSLVLNTMNLVKARREGGSRENQRKAIVGLVATGLGALLLGMMFFLRSGP